MNSLSLPKHSMQKFSIANLLGKKVESNEETKEEISGNFFNL